MTRRTLFATLFAALATAGGLGACGSENSIVGGECAPGYVELGQACVRATDGSTDGNGDADGDGSPKDGPNRDGTFFDGGEDGSGGDGSVGDGTAGDGAPGDGGGDAFTCLPNELYCSGVCIDPLTDPFNCGVCGNVCPSLLCSAGKCQGLIAGHMVVIGHDYQGSFSSAQAKVLSNAVLLAPPSAIKVRSYEQSANSAAIANVKATLNAAAIAQGRTIAYTVASVPSDVTSMTTSNTDALVVYDQVTAAAGTLAGLGAGWAATLATFTKGGGIVVVLDGQGGANPQMTALIKNANVLDVSSDTFVKVGTALNVVAPQNAVGLGVLSPYGAGVRSVYFACNEANAGFVTYVVVDPSTDAGTPPPVVVDKIVP